MKAKKIIALLTAITAAGNSGTITSFGAESTKKAASGTLYCDANLDEKVNVADAVAVLQFIANRVKY